VDLGGSSCKLRKRGDGIADVRTGGDVGVE
jgi:hypothetical protein